MHRSSTVYKPKPFLTNMSLDFDVRRQQGMDFFTGGNIMDYMDLYFDQIVYS